MPIVINRKEDSKQQTPTGQSAVVNQRTAQSSSGEPVPIQLKIMIGVVAVTVLFALFMFNRSLHPFGVGVKMPTKVAPLPGLPDEFPYNTKEWQEAFKKGKTTFLSGVPRNGIRMPSAGGNNSQPPANAGRTGTP